MELLLTMLPVYILGNLHCAGMCGPLVFILGRNPKRYWYFVGRLSSFTLAGILAGELGSYMLASFQIFHIKAVLSLTFGIAFLLYGIKEIWGGPVFRFGKVPAFLLWVQKKMAHLSTQNNKRSIYTFGFLTLFLPCGQSALVFAACALSGSALVGLINGFAFALLTTPALILILKSHGVLLRLKKWYKPLFGGAVICVGLLSVLRGLADMGLIDHLAINQSWHLILF
jgi:uncharacterized protein